MVGLVEVRACKCPQVLATVVEHTDGYMIPKPSCSLDCQATRCDRGSVSKMLRSVSISKIPKFRATSIIQLHVGG